MVKTSVELKRIEAEKDGDKDKNALYKVMNNAAYG